MTSHLAPDAVSLYQDCAERARTYAELPFGKPGRLLRKSVYGQKLVYREVSVLSGDTRLRKLGPFGSSAVEEADAVFHAATWMPEALVNLREAGFYGAARQLEEPLIAAFNLGLFASGAVLIGPLAYLFWLNELGVQAPMHAPAAPDVELALSEHAVVSDAQADFLQRCIKTRQSRLHVHFEMADYTRYLQSRMRLPYEALLKRHCFMTHLHYLTRSAKVATALVGDYLVPVLLPSPGRIYWQKLHWSRLPDNPRADAERHEALILAAAIQRAMPDEIETARRELPVQWARQLARDTCVMQRLARMASNAFASTSLFDT